MRIVRFFVNILRCIFSCISPKLNTSFNYFIHYKKRLNYKNPNTFCEKLNVLKLEYIKDPLVCKCSDKNTLNDYARECGCNISTVPIINTFSNPLSINLDNLPEQFVLKWNFGSGMNYICRDKKMFDKERVVKQFRKWGRNKQWLYYSEMQYKSAYKNKIILCEQYLNNGSDDCPDYKVYCFNGEPKAILVIRNRFTKITVEFFDINWNKLPKPLNSDYCEPMIQTPRPECLQTIISTSKKLSKPFDFVRCDFFVIGETVYIGEMTFTPNGSIGTAETILNGKSFGELLKISK